MGSPQSGQRLMVCLRPEPDAPMKDASFPDVNLKLVPSINVFVINADPVIC